MRLILCVTLNGFFFNLASRFVIIHSEKTFTNKTYQAFVEDFEVTR